MYLFFRRISRLSARMDISRRFLSSIPPDSGDIWLPSTYVKRFRSHQSLWVSDLTSAYWCEKQLEFQLLSGRDRHNQLEKEQNICHYSQMSMSQRPSANDQWIEKLTTALQKLTVLRDYKCTRELMIITSIEGHWVIGKIDELRCDRSGQLTLIGTRTRNRMPREEQKKRDHFQVMLYKHMLDSLVSRKKFPVLYFFTHFSLNRYTLLSENVVQRIQGLNMEAVTLEDLVLLYINEFGKFSMVSDELEIRYEYQTKHKVIDWKSFKYEPEEVLMIYRTCMEMLKCERTASFTKHNFKCNYCPYESSCPKKAEAVIKTKTELGRQANIAYFILVSQFKSIFLELLLSKGFVDITSKILGDSSERHPLPVLQSHHHYQQVAMSTNYLSVELPRIFWQGSVFSKEDFVSLENPCFFTCFDVDMVIGNDYTELMDTVDELYLSIFKQINEMLPKELEALRKHHPFETLKFLPKTPRITFEEGIQMLKEVGVEVSEESLETESERKLGQLIREKYNTDFYILHRFPLVASPFFTTPCENDSSYGNSFAVFLRGEIISGGQHITDKKLLKKRAEECFLDVSKDKDLLCDGAPPHGGFRMRVERMARLFVGLPCDPHGLMDLHC